jgi:hypothetical protein
VTPVRRRGWVATRPSTVGKIFREIRDGQRSWGQWWADDHGTPAPWPYHPRVPSMHVRAQPITVDLKRT